MRRPTAWLSLLVVLAISTSARAVDMPSDAAEGDLIFREGTEAVSVAVLALDRSGFSHVGMLVKERGEWAVLHATPSERAGQPDGVVIDPIAFFVHPDRARHHAVYHVDADEPARRRAVASARAQVGRRFLLDGPDGTYCTLLVWDAWRAAGVDLEVSFEALSIPMLAGRYLLPGGLLASARLKRLS
jgi:cell wall-associated NlpC family hydrolase